MSPQWPYSHLLWSSSWSSTTYLELMLSLFWANTELFVTLYFSFAFDLSKIGTLIFYYQKYPLRMGVFENSGMIKIPTCSLLRLGITKKLYFQSPRWKSPVHDLLPSIFCQPVISSINTDRCPLFSHLTSTFWGKIKFQFQKGLSSPVT